MKQCRKCSNQIPNWITVDGVRKNISKRKFCLECSPFGSHNTKDLTESDILPEDEKKVRRKKQISEAVVRRRQKIKQQAIEYKGGCCQICGYKKSVRALHFHHINPEEKSFDISRDGASRAWEKVKAELDKCILLCSNCQMEVEEGITEIPNC